MPGSGYDASILGTDNRVAWNGKWTHKDAVKDGVWYSEVTIPFRENFKKIPAQGDRWSMQIAYSSPGAQHLYAWNVPMGGFSDPTGFGTVRFGERAAGSRSCPINGDFKKRDAKGLPLLWNLHPKKATMEMVGDTLKITQRKLNFTGLYSGTRISVAPDETVRFTVTMRGNAKVAVGVGWFNNVGKWVVNDAQKAFQLTEKAKAYTFDFKVEERQLKGAFSCNLNLFVFYPGGEVLIDEVKAEVRK